MASERLLIEKDLTGLSKNDLKIMRNEIYARYGYIFKTSDMKEHFESQSWYNPQHTDVTSKLTDIEKVNVAFIKEHE